MHLSESQLSLVSDHRPRLPLGDYRLTEAGALVPMQTLALTDYSDDESSDDKLAGCSSEMEAVKRLALSPCNSTCEPYGLRASWLSTNVGLGNCGR